MLDALVIVDHRSVDGTRDVLEQLADEGLPLRIEDERSPVQDQQGVLSRLLAKESETADWLLPLDADEFLVGALHATLGEAQVDRPALVRWSSYVPTAGDDATEPNPVRRIRHRRRSEPTLLWNVIVPSRLASAAGFRLAQGAHLLNVNGDEVEGAPLPGLALAHFPVRSIAQLAAKVLAGGLRTSRAPT